MAHLVRSASRMKAQLILFVSLSTAALLSSCKTPTVPEKKAQFKGALSTYMEDMMKPLLFMCGGAGAFWVKEKRWPGSIEELADLRGADEDWKSTMSKFSEVVFDHQADGSVAITGTMRPPSTFGGLEVKAAPISFNARITMQLAPEMTSGLKPVIEVGFAKSGEEPNQLPEPTAASGRGSS
jgi:hypothetical protein